MHKAIRAVLLNLVAVVLLLPAVYYGLIGMMAFINWQWASRYFKLNREARILAYAQGFNPANIYWGVLYDCRANDVEISGILPKARYWSLVAYDRLTMPLDTYFFDETIQKDDEDRYTAYLTTRPKGRPNEIDVSAAPRGLVLIRTSFPENSDAIVAAAPQVRTLPRRNFTTKTQSTLSFQ